MVHGAGGDERFADADGQTGDDPRVKRVGQKLKVRLHALITNTVYEETLHPCDTKRHHLHIVFLWYLADLSRGECDQVNLASVSAGGQSLL